MIFRAIRRYRLTRVQERLKYLDSHRVPELEDNSYLGADTARAQNLAALKARCDEQIELRKLEKVLKAKLGE